MEDRFSQQMKKGVLEMLVLECISRGGTYGYELLTRLKEDSGGTFALKEGTLYPILYRLEDDGLIRSSWSEGIGRSAPKKIYSITDQGIRENGRRKAMWHTFTATVNTVLKGK